MRANQSRPGDEQRSNCPTVVAVDADFTIPTDPDQLGKSAGVIRVALVHSHGQRGVRGNNRPISLSRLRTWFSRSRRMLTKRDRATSRDRIAGLSSLLTRRSILHETGG